MMRPMIVPLTTAALVITGAYVRAQFTFNFPLAFAGLDRRRLNEALEKTFCSNRIEEALIRQPFLYRRRVSRPLDDNDDDGDR